MRQLKLWMGEGADLRGKVLCEIRVLEVPFVCWICMSLVGAYPGKKTSPISGTATKYCKTKKRVRAVLRGHTGPAPSEPVLRLTSRAADTGRRWSSASARGGINRSSARSSMRCTANVLDAFDLAPVQTAQSRVVNRPGGRMQGRQTCYS